MASKGKITFEGENGHVISMELTPTGNEGNPMWDVNVNMGETPEDDNEIAPVHVGLAVENLMMMKMSPAFNLKMPDGFEIQIMERQEPGEDPQPTAVIMGGPKGEA